MQVLHDNNKDDWNATSRLAEKRVDSGRVACEVVSPGNYGAHRVSTECVARTLVERLGIRCGTVPWRRNHWGVPARPAVAAGYCARVPHGGYFIRVHGAPKRAVRASRGGRVGVCGTWAPARFLRILSCAYILVLSLLYPQEQATSLQHT